MAQGRTQEAVVEGERSLALNPSFIDAYLALCAANNFLGRPDRALELADKAIRLSPRDPHLRVLYHMKGWAFFMKRQDDQAIEWLRRAEGGDVFTDLILAAALPLTGQQADARETLKRYLAVNGVTTTTIAQLRKQQLSLADRRGWPTTNGSSRACAMRGWLRSECGACIRQVDCHHRRFDVEPSIQSRISRGLSRVR